MAAPCRRELPGELAGSTAGELGPSDRRDEARLVAGDVEDAVSDARWALETGAVASESPIGRYAGALALLVLERDPEALDLATTLQGRDDFPDAVACALCALAESDAAAYAAAIRALLADFERGTGSSRTCPSRTPSSCSRRLRR